MTYVLAFAQRSATRPRAAASDAGRVPAHGEPLSSTLRAEMEPRFGHDFGKVRLHADAQAAASARAVSAEAYTVGSHIVFGAGRYQPAAQAGKALIAHELAHVVQQAHAPEGEVGTAAPVHDDPSLEAAADRTATRSSGVGLIPGTHAGVQRKVEMRDVGSGEESGFSRLPELLDRLNAMATAGTFSLTAGGTATRRVRDYSGTLVQAGQTVELQYTPTPGQTPNLFESRMRAFIEQAAVLPLRLTNRTALLGDAATGYHDRVDVDAWTSGYVDIDDVLASSDLGLQSVLLHFLTERGATANYARRIGTDTFTDAEFRRTHGLGIEAEAQLLQEFFGDPTIHIVNDSPNLRVRRVFRNSRRDLIRRIITRGTGAETGVGGSSIDVVTHDGRHLTAEEYRAELEAARAAAAPAAPAAVPVP